MRLGYLRQSRWGQSGKRWGRSLLIAILGLGAIALPGFSADTIIISYGAFERTIAIEDLVAFAEGKGLTRQLALYAHRFGFGPAELNRIQKVLNARADLTAVDMAQFLYTTQGTALLNLVGEIIQTPSRQSGFHAIRGSLILAAADPKQGLTLLNFLQTYPTPEIRIDIARGLQIAEAVTQTLEKSDQAIDLVQEKAAIAAQTPVENPLATQQLLLAPPSFGVLTESINVLSRRVVATLYLPYTLTPTQPLPRDLPLIVISHGLGDEKASYDYLGRYLSERGFAVAALNHPGSSSEQIAQLLAGLSPNLISKQEFVNRPEDISELLDTLERLTLQRNGRQWNLNLQNVGVIGHSFGGYTALALGGARATPATLSAACTPQPIYLNPSLLLQCQALEEDIATWPDLRDARVRAVLAVNPVGSALFGEAGLAQVEVPVMFVASSGDTIAPALPEQIQPFTWLKTPHRYLVLISRATHFSVIAPNPNVPPSINLPNELLGDTPEQAQEYLEILSLAFFQQHLNGDGRYGNILSPWFLQEVVARSPMEPLSLLNDLSPETLQQAITNLPRIDWEQVTLKRRQQD